MVLGYYSSSRVVPPFIYINLTQLELQVAIGASIGLVFYPDCHGTAAHAVFSLEIDSKVASAPVATGDESETLDERCMLICADDDKGPRLLYKSLVKKLDVDNHMIIGEKYTEAAGLVDIVLKAEMDFGGLNVICILDQNMDRYTEGAILGTDVTGRLRECGFKGLIFIRSANDDMASRVAYKNAGADATLSKGTKSIADLAKDIMAVRRRFLLTFSDGALS